MRTLAHPRREASLQQSSPPRQAGQFLLCRSRREKAQPRRASPAGRRRLNSSKSSERSSNKQSLLFHIRSRPIDGDRPHLIRLRSILLCAQKLHPHGLPDPQGLRPLRAHESTFPRSGELVIENSANQERGADRFRGFLKWLLRVRIAPTVRFIFRAISVPFIPESRNARNSSSIRAGPGAAGWSRTSHFPFAFGPLFWQSGFFCSNQSERLRVKFDGLHAALEHAAD